MHLDVMPDLKINNYHKTAKHSHSKITLFVLFFTVGTVSAFSQTPNIKYQTPQTYTVNNAIASLIPKNSGGAVPATIYGQVSTFVWNSVAYFYQNTAVAVDAAGNIYVEDWGHNQVKTISPSGVVSVFAGTGAAGSADGTGSVASFYEPDGMAADAAGNLYIGDQGNNLIRKITSTGFVSTLAGSGTPGMGDGKGVLASFNSPRGLAVDQAGNVYVADQANNMIRMITPAGNVTTLAGGGAAGFTDGMGRSATFNTPTGVGLDASGNVYVADAGNNAVRKITPAGNVTTVATGISFPREVRVDGTGNLYVTEQQGNSVKRISPAGVVATVAGTGQPGTQDGNGNVATFNRPVGLVLDGNGNLLVCDNGNNLLRKIIITGYTINKTLPPGLTFDPTTGIISGTPTALWPPTDYIITAYNSAGSSSTIVNIQVVNSVPLKPSIITFPVLNTSQIDPNNNIKPAATSTNPETPVTYTSSNPAVAIITPDGLIHLLAPGVTVITASQTGDANYSAATPVSQTLTVTESQVITFHPITAKSSCDADFSVDAISTNNTIPLIYASSNPAVATISAQGIVHIIGNGTTIITISQNGNTLYTPANPQSQTLTVNPPVAPIVNIAADPTSVCDGMTVTYTATVTNVTGNLSYQWQLNGVNAGTNSSTFASNQVTSTAIVKCIVTNNSSCPATGISNSITGIHVDTYVTPSILISSTNPGPVCRGTAISFTALTTNGGTSPTYQWQVNGTNAGTNSPSFTSNTLNNNDFVTCLLTNNGGACLTALTVVSNGITVSVRPPDNPAPSVTISPSSNGVYAGVPIRFTASTANANGVVDYQWQVNGTDAGTDSPVFESSTLNNGDQVICILFVKNSCTPSVTSQPVLMNILQPVAIRIPNAFTPNGDGINDRWNIPDLAYFPNCVLNIYTRYGSVIYQSRGYTTGWDGLYNGKVLPTGTYYYIIDLGNNSPKLAGYVAIIK